MLSFRLQMPQWRRGETRVILDAWLDSVTDAAAVRKHSWPPFNNAQFPWDRPTVDVYASSSGSDSSEFDGQFGAARAALDYSYHKRPAPARQRLQDAVLKGVLTEALERRPDERPWIVFTAGAMGVGKSYAMLSLHSEGLFPLDAFQAVDPDKLKGELPELRGYLHFDRPTAATRLHRESTQMADVLFEHSVMQGANVLVDGSLRDHAFYQEFFGRLRKERPNYRLAILHITAPEETVQRRVAERAANSKDGRAVPPELVKASLDQVPESVRILAPCVDFVATLSNDDDQLRLVSGADSWAEFAERWPHREGGVASMGAPAAPDAEVGAARTLESTPSRERKLVRSSIALYGTKYASTCPHCIVQGYLEAEQCCACYVTRPNWQTRALKSLERTMSKIGWFRARRKPVPRRSMIGRQQGVGAAIADITEEPTILGL